MRSALSGKTGDIHLMEPQVTSDEKRRKLFVRKALQNAIEANRGELEKHAEELQRAYNDTDTMPRTEGHVHSLRDAALRYEKTLTALGDLYEQDRCGDYADKTRLTGELQYNTIIYLKSLHREWLPIHPSQGLMIKVLDNSGI